MIKHTKYFIQLIIIGFCLGCSQLKDVPVNEEKNNIKIQLGMSHGGIVENTDKSIEGGYEIDAFTGATTPSVYCGVHYELHLKKQSIETGIDALFHQQKFTYNDPELSFYGTRSINTTQLRIPVSYNIVFGKKSKSVFIIGASTGFNLHAVNDSGINLPDYSLKNFTVGPVIGYQYFPFNFQNNTKLGFHIEMFRAFTNVYTDPYQKGSTPGLSYLKLGAVYSF